MITFRNGQDNSLKCLPKDLIEHLSGDGRAEVMLAATPYDLDEHGKFTEGYLLLTNSRFGHYYRSNGSWECQWTGIDELTEASLIEGLGMNLLRLAGEDRMVSEFRFTLRYTGLLAGFHHQLERVIAGGGQEEIELPSAPAAGEEKKVRCEKCDRLIPAWSEVCQACMSRRAILFRLLDFVKPYKWRAIGAFVIALALTGMGLVPPWFARPLINKGLGAAPGYSPDFGLVSAYVGVMSGFLIVQTFGQIIQLRLSLALGSLVSRRLRGAVYTHLHRLSLSFFSRRQTGALVTRVTNDTERLWHFVSSTFIDIILSILTIIGVGVCLFAMYWRLAVFTLMPIPLMLFLMVFFHNRLHQSFGRLWHRLSKLTAVVADALPGVRVIKAFSQEKREVNRFEDNSGALYEEEMRYFKGSRSLFGPMMMFSAGLGSLIVWLIGGWWLCSGRPGAPDVGTLMAFQVFLGMFFRPMHQIAHMDEMFNRAATSAHRVFEILDTQPVIYSKANARTPDGLTGKIELQDVTFSYDGIHKVLKNINITIEPGQMIGLAGPSGGGKTTLVNLISRMYDPQQGRILIDGVDVRDYDITQLRQKIGIVLAFVHKPDLIILDEPTTGLDPLIQQETLQIVRDAQSEGATVFFSSHIISVVEALAKRVGIIRQGVVVEIADTGELRERAVRRARIRFREPVDAGLFADLRGVTVLSSSDPTSLLLQVTGEMDTLIDKLYGLPVSDLETERATLEEIFLAYYDHGRKED